MAGAVYWWRAAVQVGGQWRSVWQAGKLSAYISFPSDPQYGTPRLTGIPARRFSFAPSRTQLHFHYSVFPPPFQAQPNMKYQKNALSQGQTAYFVAVVMNKVGAGARDTRADLTKARIARAAFCLENNEAQRALFT